MENQIINKELIPFSKILLNITKDNILPFALGCSISMLSFLEKSSPFFKYRWWIALILLLIGVLFFIYSTICSLIKEYTMAKAGLEQITGDSRQTLIIENIERTYKLKGDDTHSSIFMSIRNISENPITTIDYKLRADNGNGTNSKFPEITIEAFSINGITVPSIDGKVIDYKMVTWPNSSRKLCEITVRLPLSLEGFLNSGEKSDIKLYTILKNNLPLLDLNNDKKVAEDSITFEIEAPTRRFTTVIEIESKNKNFWSQIELSGNSECPLGVGAYSGYGSVVDQRETSRLSSPVKTTKGFKWEVIKPLLGYTYCIRHKLICEKNET